MSPFVADAYLGTEFQEHGPKPNLTRYMLAKKILDAILSHLAIRITDKTMYVISRLSFHIINIDVLSYNLIISSSVQNLVYII